MITQVFKYSSNSGLCQVHDQREPQFDLILISLGTVATSVKELIYSGPCK